MSSAPPPGGVSKGRSWPWWSVGVAALVGLLVVGVGVWARTAGLGDRSLAVDEFYFIQGIRSILDSGLPVQPGGGLYLRGALIQYLTAGVISITGHELLGLRIPSVVFGLLAVVPAYLLARRWTGPWGGVALVSMILLSSWEIEFSRFGRMYAGFQLVALAFLVAYTRAVGTGGRRALWALPPLCVAAVLCHATAVFLVPLMFVPYLAGDERSDRPALSYGLAAGAAAILTVAFEQRIGLQKLDAVDRLPQGIEPADPLVRAPFSLMSGDNLLPEGLMLVVAGAVLAAGSGWLLARGRPRFAVAVSMAALVLAAFHQLIPALLMGGAVVLRYRTALADGLVRRVLLGVVLVSLAWVVVVLALPFVDATVLERMGAGSMLGALRRTLFAWPAYYVALARVWMRDLPVLSVALMVSGVVALVAAVRLPRREALIHPAVLSLYFATVFSVLSGPEETTRYLYFVYPLFLVVLIIGSLRLAGMVPAFRGAAAGLLPAVLVFAFSRDFNPRHIRSVASDEVTYRTGDFERMELLWYPRRDYETPALYLNELELGPEDLIVAVHVPPVPYYLERDLVVYWSRQNHQFADISREEGTRYAWSGHPLVSTPEELGRVARDASRVWMVERSLEIDLAEAFGARPFRDEVVMAGRDGRISVRRVDFLDAPGGAREAVRP